MKLINTLFSLFVGTALYAAPKVECGQTILPVLLRNDNNQVLHFNITGGSEVTEIAITTKGTTDVKEIAEMSLFFSGGEKKFSTNTKFAATKSASSKITFKGAQKLGEGDNWFFVSYKMKDDAKLLNRVDAGCLYVKVDGKKVAPKVSSPKGSLRLGVALCKAGDAGSQGYRIPGMVTSNKGTLLAVYDMRYTGMRDLQGHMDIGLSRSTDGGQTWEPQKTIIDMGEWGGMPKNLNGVSDACILVDRKTNTIFCAGLWMYGLRDKEGKFMENATSGWQHQWHGTGSTPGLDPKQTCQFMMVKSTDDGKTWTEPINLTKMIKKPEWYLFAPAPGNGITMKNGTLVLPTQGRDKKGHPFSNFIYSKDRGKTWTTSEPASTNTTESAVVELSDGSLMLNSRNNRRTGRFICVTKDMGKTWKEHETSRGVVVEPVCMASLNTHRFGENSPKGLPKEVLFFSNPPQKSGRHNMTIRMSVDDGDSWPEKWHLLLDEHGGSYSSLTSINSKTLGILHEGTGARLVFQKIAIGEIIKAMR